MLTRLEEIRHEITGERLTLIEFARKLRQDATTLKPYCGPACGNAA